MISCIYTYIYTHIKYIIVYGHYLPEFFRKVDPSYLGPRPIHSGFLVEGKQPMLEEKTKDPHGVMGNCEAYIVSCIFDWNENFFNQPRKAFLCCSQCQGVDGGGPGLRSGILILFAFSLSEQQDRTKTFFQRLQALIAMELSAKLPVESVDWSVDSLIEKSNIQRRKWPKLVMWCYDMLCV